MGTVYILTNNINGKQYVGVTGRNLKQRLAEHKSSIKATTKISKAIKKHGWENFSHEVLHEHHDFSTLLQLEGKEILARQTFGSNGYNSKSSGSSDVRYVFRPSDVTQSIVRMYADSTGGSITQTLNTLIQLGGTVWLQNLYKGDD